MGFPALRTHAFQGAIIQLSGFSHDSTGAILPNCTVMMFRTSDNTFISSVVSDSNGYWHMPGVQGVQYFLVEYLAGSPDVFGTSVNTLVPV